MKKNTSILLSLLVLLLLSGSTSAQMESKNKTGYNLSGSTLRTHLNFNREWRFTLGDSINAQNTTYNDNSWSRVGLPHSFSIPYFMWKNVYNGYGWYRKQFEVPSSWNGKTVSIEFEGSFIETEVFVNGRFVGKHVGGYTGFNFDITRFVKTGTNLIAVRVNNLWNARVAPRAGDHQFSGGIYRDVFLNVTDNLHVDWCGTFVSTPIVNKSSATCKVQTEVRNNYNEDKNCTVKTEIADPDGKMISMMESTEVVQKNQVRTFSQTLPAIANPKLWCPESPFLHKAITTVLCDGKAIDRYETTFGIRWFSWSATEGFFLNGEHYYLLGANVHQDHAGWGDAVTNAGFKRDVQMMKDAGFNSIRGSHYPHDPAFTKACDEIGMIYFSENAFWGMGGGSGDRNGWGTPSSSCYPPNAADQPHFDQSVITQLKEMIKIDHNKASIIAWSMSNEPFFTDASTITPMKALLNAATDSTRKWDPTRLVAIGGAQRQGVDKLGKGAVAFYNGDGASFANPGVPSMVSEYSSRSTQRPGDFSPAWGELGDGWGRPIWRGGQVIWCGFDHGTVGGEGLATMGLVDYFRLPKRQYFWYQEAYAKGNPTPTPPQWPKKGTPAKLKIEAGKTTITSTDGTDDIQLIISVLDAANRRISNNVPIKLSIVSGPGEFPTGTSIRFIAPSSDEASDIFIRDGQAAIEFRSYYAGKTVIEATSPGLKKATFTITTQGSPVWVKGVTPKIKERPYSRYKENRQSTSANELLLAKNRPSSVSSALPGTNKVNANDDEAGTIWNPEASDTGKWWKLDLEAAYCLNRIQLEFPTADAYKYIIEVSSDDQNWTTVIDRSNNSEKNKVRMEYGNWGRNVRFVRIKFTSALAGLAEVRIGGTSY